MLRVAPLVWQKSLLQGEQSSEKADGEARVLGHRLDRSRGSPLPSATSPSPVAFTASKKEGRALLASDAELPWGCVAVFSQHVLARGSGDAPRE